MKHMFKKLVDACNAAIIACESCVANCNQCSIAVSDQKKYEKVCDESKSSCQTCIDACKACVKECNALIEFNTKNAAGIDTAPLYACIKKNEDCIKACTVCINTDSLTEYKKVALECITACNECIQANDSCIELYEK